MNGRFGVFDGMELVGGEFGDDESADEYRRVVLELDLPEHLRSSLYDPHQLEVREIPDDYENYLRVLRALREEDTSAAA